MYKSIMRAFHQAVSSARQLLARNQNRTNNAKFTSESFYKLPFRRVNIDGYSYFVPLYAVHRPAAQCVLAGDIYEPLTHSLIKHVFEKEDGSLVHAGTFFGDMLPAFSSAVKSNVYAFEPVLENYILANLCVRENNLNNVLLFNGALGIDSCLLKISTWQDDGTHRGGSSQVADLGDPCLCLSIDSVVTEKISMIQLDVEGFELEALKGAAKTISDWKPIILVEDNPGRCESFFKSHHYSRRFTIPGLSVWCSEDRDDHKTSLEDFAKNIFGQAASEN